MLTEKDAQELLTKYTELKTLSEKEPSVLNKKNLEKHKNMCAQKFSYLVSIKTSRYKNFSNYEDLMQEAFLALMHAMDSYDVKKGSAFWWIHKYLDTRIVRSANNHSVIRYPMKVAKNQVPHKENVMPTLIENIYNPDDMFEKNEFSKELNSAFSKLSNEQQEVVDMVYGLTNKEPASINRVCEDKNISRAQCLKILKSAIKDIRSSIKA